MANASSEIEWCDATWNPTTGCSHVSEGCRYCYAEKISTRRRFTTLSWTAPNAAANVVSRDDRLAQPLHWRTPRRIFVNSMSDLFHELVPDEFIAVVFGVMAACPQHTFIVLTKRPERMRQWFAKVEEWAEKAREVFPDEDLDWRRIHCVRAAAIKHLGSGPFKQSLWVWPLPNVWLLTSCEDQPTADQRIPILLDTPAAVHGVSLEPLLGPIDMGQLTWIKLARPIFSDTFPGIPRPMIYAPPGIHRAHLNPHGAVSVMTPSGKVLGIKPDEWEWKRSLGWVIVGGESGGPEERRLVSHLGNRNTGQIWAPKLEAVGWVESIRLQCSARGVPFFFKAWGGPTSKSGGRFHDGREWSELPEVDRQCLQ